MFSSNALPMFKQGTPLGSCLIRLGVRGIYSSVFLFQQKRPSHQHGEEGANSS